MSFPFFFQIFKKYFLLTISNQSNILQLGLTRKMYIRKIYKTAHGVIHLC